MSIYNPEASPQIDGDDFLIGGSFIAGVNSDGELECNPVIMTGGQAVAYQIWISKMIQEGILNVGNK